MIALLLGGVQSQCVQPDGTGIRLAESCNFVGHCFSSGNCLCCSEASFCEEKFPEIRGVYTGESCEKITYYLHFKFSYLVEGDEVTCANDQSSVPSFLEETRLLFENYTGLIDSLPCEVTNDGIVVNFASDLNTFYDHGCAKDFLPEGIAEICTANYDRGLEAWEWFNEYYATLENSVLSDMMGLSSDTAIQLHGIVPGKTESTFEHISFITRAPSPAPTVVEVRSEATCEKFSHKVSEFLFLGVGSSCRDNINETWPGARTCESPYIVCLPKENTPGEEFMGRKYYNNTHRYSVDECKQECALDQRCRGFEFVADMNSSRGNCTLIDDIHISIVNSTNFEYVYNRDDENLYDSLGGDAACFEKQFSCNPHFTSEDLNETMLACYCPNNRKGSYTKKVKRTVNNTRFCGDDYTMDERIKYAQANRMFHLCENWCLFNTLNPELESWYWDPWKSCWRETYSANGVHRGYCDRVIRNPDSIELKFVNERSNNIITCGYATSAPTLAPVHLFNTSNVLGYELESCDDACSRNNLTCAADQTARRFANETELIKAFSMAGHSCDVARVTMNDTRLQGWALPGLRGGSICTNRQPTPGHLEDLDSDCHRIIGESWQRLCACY